MKVNAHLKRRANELEVCEEAKALTEIYKDFFASERPNSKKCPLCERGDRKQSASNCKRGYQMRTTESRWSHALADLIKDSVYLLKDVAGTDVTAPTPVALPMSLACLALLPSTMEALERKRVEILIDQMFHMLFKLLN